MDWDTVSKAEFWRICTHPSDIGADMSCKEKKSPENQSSAYKAKTAFRPGFFYITGLGTLPPTLKEKQVKL